MNWVNKHKLPAVEVVKHNGWPCLKISNLWHVLHSLFNIAQDCQIDIEILNEIPSKSSLPWVPFSEEKFISSVSSVIICQLLALTSFLSSSQMVDLVFIYFTFFYFIFIFIFIFILFYFSIFYF